MFLVVGIFSGISKNHVGQCSHVWVPANCFTPITCRKCGETLGSAGTHRWKKATCTAAKTCSDCGATYGRPLNHQWLDASYNAPKTCMVCGASEGESLPLPPSGRNHSVNVIAAGKLHTAVLFSDGTVRAKGNNTKGQCDVSA